MFSCPQNPSEIRDPIAALAGGSGDNCGATGGVRCTSFSGCVLLHQSHCSTRGLCYIRSLDWFMVICDDSWNLQILNLIIGYACASKQGNELIIYMKHRLICIIIYMGYTVWMHAGSFVHSKGLSRSYGITRHVNTKSQWKAMPPSHIQFKVSVGWNCSELVELVRTGWLIWRLCT